MTHETKNIETPNDPKLSKIGLAGNLARDQPKALIDPKENAHDHPITDPIQHIQETPQDRRRQQLDRLHKHLLRGVAPGRLAQGEVRRTDVAEREVTCVRWRRIRGAGLGVGVCPLEMRGFGGGEKRGTFRGWFVVDDGRRGSGTRRAG